MLDKISGQAIIDLNEIFNQGSSINNVGYPLGDALNELIRVFNAKGAYEINEQIGTEYEVSPDDCSRLVILDNPLPITVTVPIDSATSYPSGFRVDFIQKGVGKVTFAGAVGVTIKSKNDNKSIAGQNVAVSLIRESTDVWYLIGDLIV